MGKRLASRVASYGGFHQACVQAVLQIAFQNSVFYQGGALGRVAFIVNVQRTAALCQRAIIHHVDTGRSYPFAEPTGKGAGAFAVEVAFESMPNGFMQ